MKHKILIVDDEVMLTELLSAHLQDCGYETLSANDAGRAVELLSKEPDLILLDINMPGIDGLALCRSIREHVSCPILFLTARVTEQDMINGFGYGGDDYITKPFRLNELTARIAAHLRRDERSRQKQSVLSSGLLLVNLSERKVFYGETEIPFSRREFDLIEFFLTNANQVFDRDKIYEAVWGYDAEGDSGVIKEHVRKIRTKLKEYTGKEFIETVWGVGYQWKSS